MPDKKLTKKELEYVINILLKISKVEREVLNVISIIYGNNTLDYEDLILNLMKLAEAYKETYEDLILNLKETIEQ